MVSVLPALNCSLFSCEEKHVIPTRKNLSSRYFCAIERIATQSRAFGATMAPMRWVRAVTRLRLVLIFVLMVLPFLFSAVGDILERQKEQTAIRLVNRLETVMTRLRSHTGRLTTTEAFGREFDIGDVIYLQGRLRDTATPDPLVTEYFLSVNEYLVGVGYSYVRPHLFYEAVTLGSDFDRVQLRDKIETKDVVTAVLHSREAKHGTGRLLVSYQLPRYAVGAPTRLLAFVDLSEIQPAAEAAGYYIESFDDEIHFTRVGGSGRAKYLIRSQVLPLSYAVAGAGELLGAPFLHVFLTSFGLALVLFLGDVLYFLHRYGRVESIGIGLTAGMLGRQESARRILGAYAAYVLFRVRYSRRSLVSLVGEWLAGGNISTRDHQSLVITLSRRRREWFCVAYGDRQLKQHRRSGAAQVVLAINEGEHRSWIVSGGFSSDGLFRRRVNELVDGYAGVGTRSNNVLQLPSSFIEAKEAYSRRGEQGDNHPIVFFADLPELQLQSFYFPIEIEAGLLNSLRSGATEKAVCIVEELFQRNRVAHARSARMWSAFVHNLKCTLLKLLPEIRYQDNRQGLRLKEDLLSIDEQIQSTEEVSRIITDMAEMLRAGREDQPGRVFRAIKKYIDGSFRNQELSLKLLAREFHLSESHISRSIKEQFGVSYHQYVEGLRLDYAAKQLIETANNISDIAAKSGYMNLNTFRKAFVRSYSLSPQAYRRHVHGGNQGP